MTRSTLCLLTLNLIVVTGAFGQEDYRNTRTPVKTKAPPMEINWGNQSLWTITTRKHVARQENRGDRAIADARLAQILLRCQEARYQVGQDRAELRQTAREANERRLAAQQTTIDLSQRLVWPRVLKGEEFASGRRAVESIVHGNVAAGSSERAVEQISQVTETMFQVLKRNRDNYGDHSAAEAKRYLDALVRAMEDRVYPDASELAAAQ
jgi:hypothetical protein